MASHGFREIFKVYVNYISNINLDVNASNIFSILSFGAYRWAFIMMPFFALLIVLALLGTVLQTRFYVER